MSETILEIQDLQTGFETERGLLRAVDGVSFSVNKGKTLGIVGESGCGKSVTAMSIIRLLPQPAGKILGGKVLFNGKDLTSIPDDDLYGIRGNEIGVIFQEPMTALNPVQKIGTQVSESLMLHKKMDKAEAWKASIGLLDQVGIPSPEIRVSEYPHQLSGGMRQRVVIAIAMACKPSLLIADEPTTALDVTIQAQILDLMEELQQKEKMAIIMITHDLGVIAETCDDVVVMYAGRIVEKGSVERIFANPMHAYTKGLINSIPRLDHPPKSVLNTIPGIVPSLAEMPTGCRFSTRYLTDEHQGCEADTIRPDFKEVEPGHYIEACPICTTDS